MHDTTLDSRYNYLQTLTNARLITVDVIRYVITLPGVISARVERASHSTVNMSALVCLIEKSETVHATFMFS